MLNAYRFGRKRGTTSNSGFYGYQVRISRCSEWRSAWLSADTKSPLRTFVAVSGEGLRTLKASFGPGSTLGCCMFVMDSRRYPSTGVLVMSSHNIERSSDPDTAISFVAIKKAGLSASALARAHRSKFAVWKDGHVVFLTHDEFEGKPSVVREQTNDDYGKSEQ